jgi:hypothetical protein
MKEILPNIGYTSLPVLAISSLEDRGMQELKRELSSLCMRTPVEEPVAVDHVQKALTAQFNFESDQALSKLRRTWQPMEKFQLSSKQHLDPSSCPYLSSSSSSSSFLCSSL